MTDVDRVIAAMGLPRHPGPHELTNTFRALTGVTERELNDAIRRASILAARGYSSNTLGDGGSRGTDDTSSTERHATTDYGTQWHDIDYRLAEALATIHHTTRQIIQLVADINHHASDVDPIPVGQGECMACDRTCKPRSNPSDRLRGGLCPADYMAWRRAGSPHHGQWITERRKQLTDDQGRIHPPPGNNTHTPTP